MNTAAGHNSAGGVELIAAPFLSEIEARYDALATMKGEYMASCKGVREEIKTAYNAAADAGVPKRALKAIVKRRELETRIKSIASDSEFDFDEMAIYQQLCDVYGALGEASARRAGFEVSEAGTVSAPSAVAAANDEANEANLAEFESRMTNGGSVFSLNS